MKLTPLDIRHREFKRGMRGYADAEVDEFLDEVADEFERLFKDNIDVGERLEALESQLAGYRRIEETLQKTLVSAQASADELKMNSSKEAELILHEAELKGRQLVNEAYSERQSIEQSLAMLKSAEQDFRFKFRQLLEGYLRHLGDAEPGVAVVSPDGAAQAEFARHAEAIKEAIAREEAAPAVESPEALTPTGEPSAAPDVTADVPVAEVSDADVDDTEFIDEAPPEYSIDTAPRPAPELPTQPGPGAAEPPPARERILFGETDDLLADVDSGVNENEFKW
ncbi:MAG: DivIVA domain-containing protein [Actinobacteria bacterium]|nr:DivIVA domain-containing protein [Actinomycetota bacterium]